MKIHITNYSFNATAGTIAFNDYPTGIALNNVLLITNVTVGNTIIYNFGVTGLGGTVLGNVLTLAFNTSAASMHNTDSLLIYYDDNTIPVRDVTVQLLENQNDLLRRMVKLLESSATVDSNNRQRVVLEGGASSQITASIVGGSQITASIVAYTSVPTINTQNSSVGTTTANGWQIAAGGTGFTPYSILNVPPTPTVEGPVGQEWRVADSARSTFATGIRTQIK